MGNSTNRSSRRAVVLGATLIAAGALVGMAGFATAAPADPGGNGRANTNANATAAHDNGNGRDDLGRAGTTGDTSEPQPLSNADQNNGGANGQCPDGPYCSTRDGSPSGNGNGNGKAVGKPCAGCVGKADNKNPPGQKPNGSDANAGYECDRNHGIGRTNPAHTGCETPNVAPSPTPSPTKTSKPPKPSPSPSPSKPPHGSPSPAPSPSVLGEHHTTPPQTSQPSVLGETLPVTGIAVAALVASGLLALVFGLVLQFTAHRRADG